VGVGGPSRAADTVPAVRRTGRGGRLAAALAFALCAVSIAAAPAAGSAAKESKAPIPASSGWKRYVVDPGDLVYPKAVFVIGASTGVVNPQGLKGPGGGATTLTAGDLTPDGVGTPALLLDLGANVGGYVEVGVSSSNGTPIRLGYSESAQYMTPRGDTGGPSFSFGASDDPDARTDFIQTTGPVEFRSPGIRGAQRYISIQLDAAGAASIDYVRVRTEHLHPGAAKYSGYFLSNDRLLNQIWYASAYTFAMDSFKDLRPGFASSQTVVTDGAKRDRAIWAGDMGVENLVGNYSLRSAPQILRRSLQAFSCRQYGDGQLAPVTQIAAQCPRNPPPPVASPGQGVESLRLPEYTAVWVYALEEYYMLTGDRQFAHRMMPVARRALAYFVGHLDGGLFRTPSDGVTINWHPNDAAGGIDAYTNASVYRGLIAGSALERRVGRGRRAARAWLEQAGALRTAMLARLWDPQAGAFLLNTDDPSRNHTEDAQVQAVLGGITSPSQSRQALRFIDSRLATTFGVANGEYDDDPFMSRYISPFIESTELRARLSVGDTDGALNLMRRSWGRMLAVGPGTAWESMRLDGLPKSGGISLAHGWAGGPLPALSEYVLGIRPAAPGYRHWIVAPQPGDLRFAQGEAPSPHGPIASRWRRGGGSFKLTVVGPRGTSGVVDVPLVDHRRTIALDGKVVWPRGPRGKRRGDVVRFKKISGQHTFVAR
jgi:alpha-L-rhamnosidase